MMHPNTIVQHGLYEVSVEVLSDYISGRRLIDSLPGPSLGDNPEVRCCSIKESKLDGIAMTTRGIADLIEWPRATSEDRGGARGWCAATVS